MKLSQFGPGALVAAAFIGPGTVVTASLAGANYGYALLWALAFSVFACLILQEMSARIGLVTQAGLGENIRLAADFLEIDLSLGLFTTVTLYAILLEKGGDCLVEGIQCNQRLGEATQVRN